MSVQVGPGIEITIRVTSDTDGMATRAYVDEKIQEAERGEIKTVNGEAPDENGNVQVSGLPEVEKPHQQLVTDANGNAVWEERLAYMTEVELMPETELTVNSVGTSDMARLEVEFALPQPVQYGDTMVVYVDGQRYAGLVIDQSTAESLHPDGNGLGSVMLNHYNVDTELKPAYTAEGMDENRTWGLRSPDGQTWYISAMYNGTDDGWTMRVSVYAPYTKAIDPKYLPEGGVGYEAEVVAFPETTATSQDMHNGVTPIDVWTPFEATPITPHISAGDVITLVLDGVEYPNLKMIEATPVFPNTSWLAVEGDPTFQTTDGREVAFMLGIDDLYEQRPALLGIEETEEYFTATVAVKRMEIRKIDQKFLPEDVVGTRIVFDTTSDTPTCSHTIDEIESIIMGKVETGTPVDVASILDVYIMCNARLDNGISVAKAMNLEISMWDGLAILFCFVSFDVDSEEWQIRHIQYNSRGITVA